MTSSRTSIRRLPRRGRWPRHDPGPRRRCVPRSRRRHDEDGPRSRAHERVVLFDQADPLLLESGAALAPVEVAYETYGTLDEDAANAVFVCHALTGDAHAAGHHGDPDRDGWWDNLIGPGRPIDTDRSFVICPNLLGGCQGRPGPRASTRGPVAPTGLTSRCSRSAIYPVHRRLLAHLGIERVHLAMGGSLGGMQALQWSLDHPGEVERAAVICASAKLSAQNIAFSAWPGRRS